MYADDFIITGATREVLEDKVKPAVENFLRERGLSLSQEKTKITHIDEGFDFLGFNLRKYHGKLIIKPAKENSKAFLKGIRETIKSNNAVTTELLIHLLNPKIRGWANYYRHVCSKQTFLAIDHRIFMALWRWAKRRHPENRIAWIRNKYFRSQELRNWIFTTRAKKKNGNPFNLDLFSAGSVPYRYT